MPYFIYESGDSNVFLKHIMQFELGGGVKLASVP